MSAYEEYLKEKEEMKEAEKKIEEYLQGIRNKFQKITEDYLDNKIAEDAWMDQVVDCIIYSDGDTMEFIIRKCMEVAVKTK